MSDEVAWRLFVAPASITRVAFRDSGPVVVSFNEIGHLLDT